MNDKIKQALDGARNEIISMAKTASGVSLYSFEPSKSVIESIDKALEDLKVKEPVVNFGDARVQQVYEILCANEAPTNDSEHWEGFAARRIVDALFAAPAPDDRDKRIASLEAEVRHWKANHDNMKERCAWLSQRPDLPVDRIPAYEAAQRRIAELEDELKALKEREVDLNRLEELIGQYWQCAYEEGQGCNRSDEANQILHEIRTLYRVKESK